MNNIEKIRPRAFIQFSEGNDGRDSHYYIEYRCAGCNRCIRKGDIACDQCGTFHDWSKTASIVIRREIEWT